MVLEPDIRWCARWWPSRRVDCEIIHQLERETKRFLEGCGNLKIIRLTVIRNESKQTISASNGLGRLQIVSERDTRLSAR